MLPPIDPVQTPQRCQGCGATFRGLIGRPNTDKKVWRSLENPEYCVGCLEKWVNRKRLWEADWTATDD